MTDRIGQPQTVCPRKKSGRPRAFDRETALDAALRLFWERGFEGVELRELTAAMGIHPPSFYAAFGDKKALFLEAADRYEAVYMSQVARAMTQATTARLAAAALFDLSISLFTRPGEPRGCFLTVAAVNCGLAHADIRHELAKRRAHGFEAIRARMAQGVADGDLPEDSDVDGLAVYVSTVAAGLSMQARDGAERAALAEASRLALAGFAAVAA